MLIGDVDGAVGAVGIGGEDDFVDGAVLPKIGFGFEFIGCQVGGNARTVYHISDENTQI